MAEKTIVDWDNVKGGYTGSAFINTSGDTIRSFTTARARPGQIYEVKYTSKPGSTQPILTTSNETGELKATNPVRINFTSDWGKQINDTFLKPAMELPITTDLSKKPWWARFIYKIFGNKQGGTLNYFDYLQ